MTNAEIARVLREIALFLEMNEVAFKPRAYEKAAQVIEALEEPISARQAAGGIKAVAALPSIGKGIAERIDELLRTGASTQLDALRQKIPVDVSGLTAIEGVGPKAVKAFFEELGVRTVADLEQAALIGRIRALPRFGAKSEEKILKALAFLRHGAGRRPIGTVLELAREIAARLRALPEVTEVVIGGSIRRRRELIGDADFVVVASRADHVMQCFVDMPEVAHIHGQGLTKAMVRLANGMDADLRVVPAESFGAALSYFTGSKAHNVKLRRIALAKGLKLNEYGLFDGDRAVAGRTEEELYAALGLQYVPPELREDTGEIELAQAGQLPRLIEYGDVRGDLQVQTTWTDGAHSIEDMAAAAQQAGLEYIAITDHTRGLPMTGGSDERQLILQMAAIKALNKRLRGFRVLTGAEVNINHDGSLDIADEVLAQLDVVGVAVHSHFDLGREEMMRRLIRAMENPHADILFHPTARRLMKREPINVELDAIIAAAKRTKTVLEIDSYPERLDLKDEHVRKAVQAGVKLTVDSDAHHRSHFRFIDDFGVAVARRGWATRKDVINTLPAEGFLRGLKGGGRTAS